ncbi:MAG: TolC family protein [Candidatus Omnitrophota bacterium]
MQKKRIILLNLIGIAVFIVAFQTVSFPYNTDNTTESLTKYIVNISRDISNSIFPYPKSSIVTDSKGSLKLKMLISPWGELKDVYIYESSGSDELDSICLQAVWSNDRYEPFPEALGEEERWIDIPVLFENIKETPEYILDDTDMDVHLSSRDLLGIDRDVLPEGNASGSTHVLGIEEAIDIAMENHTPAEIARDEISLSNLKMKEAKRALFPTGSLNMLETIGRTTERTQDFTDREYKLKFEYPLFYGWRLRYAVEKARANIKTSEENYDKVLQDLRGEVEAAFYSYVAKKSNLKLQRNLLESVKGVFDIAKKRHALGLSTNSEFLQVQSQMEQVNYQVVSSENDLSIAKLTLQQAVNLEDTKELEKLIDMDVDIEDLKPLSIDAPLEKCLELAFKYRPDLKAKKHNIEFNEYEDRIQKSKDQIKVDLTGSYGRSGGAFQSESLLLSNDWYLGLKASKPLGVNTLSTAMTKEETTEKHGQTSRTESMSRSLELGLIDNLQSFSEKKTSEIALKKAKDELDQMKDAIIKEINEAYLSYKKEIMQVASSLNKINYKEEELNIAKARLDLNEIPYSQLIQAYMTLNDEKTYYVEAIGSLYQSLSTLNKATGYTLFLDSENFMLADSRKK